MTVVLVPTAVTMTARVTARAAVAAVVVARVVATAVMTATQKANSLSLLLITKVAMACRKMPLKPWNGLQRLHGKE